MSSVIILPIKMNKRGQKPHKHTLAIRPPAHTQPIHTQTPHKHKNKESKPSNRVTVRNPESQPSSNSKPLGQSVHTQELETRSKVHSTMKEKHKYLVKWYDTVQKQYEVKEKSLSNEMSRLETRYSLGRKNPQEYLQGKVQALRMSVPAGRNNPRSTHQDLSIQSYTRTNPREQPRILDAIGMQIKLSEQLRLFKHKVTLRNSEAVAAVMQNKYGVGLEICSEEFEPFVVLTERMDAEEIADGIWTQMNRAKHHWDLEVYKRFQPQEVGKFFRRIDSQGSGKVGLMDFVLELGICLNLNLRKRSVFKLFNKLAEESLITLDSCLKELCSPR